MVCTYDRKNICTPGSFLRWLFERKRDSFTHLLLKFDLKLCFKVIFKWFLFFAPVSSIFHLEIYYCVYQPHLHLNCFQLQYTAVHNPILQVSKNTSTTLMIQLLNIVYLLYYLLSTNLSPLTCVKIQHLLCRYQHGQELLNATVHLFDIKVECCGK